MERQPYAFDDFWLDCKKNVIRQWYSQNLLVHLKMIIFKHVYILQLPGVRNRKNIGMKVLRYDF